MGFLDSTGRRAALQLAATRKLVARGTALPLLTMNKLTREYYRTLWLGSAARHGVLAALAGRPLSVAELAGTLGMPASAHDGLGAWLDLAVSVGLLRRRRGSYALAGDAKPLAKRSNDAVAAFYTELVELEYPLVTEAIERLRSGRPFEIADADAELIARSSRIADPYLAAALELVVPTEGPAKLVEVGCGSGAHIRSAAALNPQLRAHGIELQAPAADLARRNMAEWGLDDRVEIVAGDVRAMTGDRDAHVITLHQNIYYFPNDQRVDLLRHLGSFLRPGGQLLVTTICAGTGHASAGLDLWCALTDGADRLPGPGDLSRQLAAAGYLEVAETPITPDGMFIAVTGRWA